MGKVVFLRIELTEVERSVLIGVASKLRFQNIVNNSQLWHHIAHRLCELGLLIPLDDICYYELTAHGSFILSELKKVAD